MPAVLLFSYGTLQDPAVQMANFGRLLEGTADQLVGYVSLWSRSPTLKWSLKAG